MLAVIASMISFDKMSNVGPVHQIVHRIAWRFIVDMNAITEHLVADG